MKNPILQFNFAFKNKQPSPITFTNPVDVIYTKSLAGVNDCLTKLQTYIDAGYYVAGYISYEATYAFYDIDIQTPNNKMPLIWFGVFPSYTESAISVNEQKHQTKKNKIGPWQLQMGKEQYISHIETILQKIATTKIKEVNYTAPFTTRFTGDAYTYYQTLGQAQQSDFNAYLDIGDYQILSASPELFFQVEAEEITVRPMKGTIKRGYTYETDQEHYHWLAQSKKNKIENELTTTLMAKELEQVANKDSIHVVEPYKIEQYPTVYQMTSTVKGTLLPAQKMTDIMKKLFPCGSISGVPKKETIELIAALEANPREVYCGAIGFITPDQDAVFNVPIRTVFIDKTTNLATYGAGGGITAQSKPEEEYEEMFTKTKVLQWEEPTFSLLETFGLKNGQYIVFEQHIKRLKQAAAYFRYRLPLEDIKQALHHVKEAHATGDFRVRLTVDQDGEFNITAAPLKVASCTKVALASQPIDTKNRFLYFKTTYRDFFQQHTHNHVFDTLLWNERNEITEFTIGNVVVELNGEKYTPPVSAGLLNGTFRQQLLEDGLIKERRISKQALEKASRIWLINSVREWIEVDLVK